MSVIIMVGFAGVSMYTNRVLGRTAAFHAPERRGSTKVVSTPNRGRRRGKISVVAAKELAPDTTVSPRPAQVRVAESRPAIPAPGVRPETARSAPARAPSRDGAVQLA